MNASNIQIFDAVISAVAVVILAAIGRGLLVVRRDFRRFMGEHMWLLATTLWTRDNVIEIMKKLQMPINNEPPRNLPK